MNANKHKTRWDKLRDIGVVYVVHDKGRGLSKIGMTCEQDPMKRVGTVKSQSGVKDAEIWISPKTKNARRLEYKAHQRFDCKRQHGEWFSVGIEDVIKYVNENIERVSQEYYKEKELEAERDEEVFTNAIKKMPWTDCECVTRDNKHKFSPIKAMWCNWISCQDMEPPKIHGFEILADIGGEGCHNPIGLSYNKWEKQWECDLGFECFEIEEHIINAWMPIVFPDEFEAVCQVAAS